MNYLDLIISFWRSNEVHSFSTTEIALYFHLLEICNRCNWTNPFKRNNAKILADLGIRDRRTLDNARNKLKQAGLIDFIKSSTNPNVTYSITSTFNAQVDVQDNAQVNAQGSVQVTAQVDGTKYKLNKTKQKNNTTPLPPEKGEQKKSKILKGGKEYLLDDLKSFVNPDVLPFYLEYIQMREEIKKPFKSKRSIRANYELLQKLSEGNIKIAKEVLNQSIANQWQGIFPLKQVVANKNFNVAGEIHKGDLSARPGIDIVNLEEEAKKRAPIPKLDVFGMLGIDNTPLTGMGKEKEK